MRILNCTNHNATDKQLRMGVIEPDEQDKRAIQQSITFELPVSMADIRRACDMVTEYTEKYGCAAALIGGAPFLQGYLESSLFAKSLCAAFAFTRRISAERKMPDGSVEKVSVFDSAATLVKHPDGTLETITL